MASLFQERVLEKYDHSPRELREIILTLFPPGLQAIRNEEPREVKFKGLAFMDNSRPRFIELGFDRLYQMTQYGERSREQVLEELIPELWPSVLNNWVGVVEMQEDPKRQHHSISTTFDHNSSRGTYFVRKTF